MIDGYDYFVPDLSTEMPEVGAVTGFGDTLDEAVQQMNDHAEQVEGFQLVVQNGAFEKAQEAIDKGKAVGIEFD